MTEDQLERETLAWLQDVGYTHIAGPDIAPERSDYRQVLLAGRLRAAGRPPAGCAGAPEPRRAHHGD